MGLQSAYTLTELMVVAGLIATVSAVSIRQLLVGLDDWRTLGAVRYVSARLY